MSVDVPLPVCKTILGQYRPPLLESGKVGKDSFAYYMAKVGGSKDTVNLKWTKETGLAQHHCRWIS